MQITSFSDYSLRALIYLAVKEDKASITEISSAFKISRNHLVKAVHRLIQLGYLRSFRGKMGGILLNRHPEAINLGKIIQQLEPHMDIVECFNRTADTCTLTPACRLKGVFKEAKGAFLQTLEKYSLADLIENKSTLKLLMLPEKNR